MHVSRSRSNAPFSGVAPPTVAIISLIALVGCDRPAPLGPQGPVTASYLSIVGNYAATGTATVKTWFGSKTYSCSATIAVPTQADSTFTGTVTVQGAGDCSSNSGTVAGVVRQDGSVTAMAYASDGATVWQEGATRSGCTLVSGSSFTGTLSGNTFSVAASGAYSCPSWFGSYRVDVDAHITGTRS
jgi:disulfide bond formation protein DsbB